MRINPKAVIEEVNNLSDVFEALTTETGVLDSEDPCYDYFADSLDRLKTLVMNGLTPVEKRELILAQVKEEIKEKDPKENPKVISFPSLRYLSSKDQD